MTHKAGCMLTIAIFGAAGNMGTRARNRLDGDPSYRVLHVEGTEAGMQRLREQGVEPTSQLAAAGEADVVLLAVPDHLIGRIAAELVPALRPRTLVICLDPAAPFGSKLPPRDDISYFVTHPAHPPVFNDETDPEARRDFFGSGFAKQAIVSALMQGSEQDYQRGEAISRKLFGPILRSHRVTVEQMALLEPVLSETVAATCLTMIREAMDESIRRGVPAEAARDFLMGHINIELAILFNEIDWQFSAGCKVAIEEAKGQLFQSDWKKVFEADAVRESVRRITGG
jgi:D-apionate oxidoisomerase